MPFTVTLRDAVEADLPDVLRLVRGLAEYERLLHRMTATETDFARALFGSPPRAHAMLADAEQRPVGIALWYYLLSTFTARPILFLEDIYVDPAHRGQGIGFAMFRRLATIARANNCLSMDWRVLNWNQPAIDFYRRIGARPMTDWTVQQLDTEGLAALAEA
jgi:GNAT superfamily N-acetyltransferase